MIELAEVEPLLVPIPARLASLWLIQISVAPAARNRPCPGRLLAIPQRTRELAMADTKHKQEGAGESQSGAYPSPRERREGEAGEGGFLGHGGQSDIGYEGADNPNATTEDQGEEDDERP